MFKKLSKKKLITIYSLGAVSTAAVPAIVLPIVLLNHPGRTIKEYISNPRQLANDLQDSYQVLSEQAKISKPYNDWIDYIKGLSTSEAMDVDNIVSKIENSNMSEDLKKFMLSNYIDKVSIQKDYQANTEPIKTKPEHTIPITEIDKHKGERIPGARYVLEDVSYTPVDSWDLDEAKGVIDPISGKYFSQLLGDAERVHAAGWYNYDATSNWAAYNVKMAFKDLFEGKTDDIYLHYNAAQREVWYTTNEDYAFVGMLAADKNHIMDDPLSPGTKVPSILVFHLTDKEWTTLKHEPN